MTKKFGSLGKGLGALLPTDTDIVSVDNSETINEKNGSNLYFLCPISLISPNPNQPRREMDETQLKELCLSIQEKGIIQPLLVRRQPETHGYELIAGERRLRAAKLAKMDKVPVIVKDIGENNQESLEIALIENIQRQNLNPLDEALSYSRLSEEFKLTQEQIASKVGKERSTIANSLRLLNLPMEVLDDLRKEKLTSGHARALLSLIDSPQLLLEVHNKIIEDNLSVRQAEHLAKKSKLHSKRGKKHCSAKEKHLTDSYCRVISLDIERHLGTKNKIIQNGSRGKIEIEYFSTDDLERIISIILKK